MWPQKIRGASVAERTIIILLGNRSGPVLFAHAFDRPRVLGCIRRFRQNPARVGIAVVQLPVLNRY